MAKVNLSKAALLVEKNRTTIWRHIKQGKVSIERDRDGNPLVDTSELLRVYGELKPVATPKIKNIQHQATDRFSELIAEVAALRKEHSKLVEELVDLKLRLYAPTIPSTITEAEKDPDWPSSVNSIEDINLRNKIREKYQK